MTIRLLPLLGLCACHALPSSKPVPSAPVAIDTTMAAAARIWKSLPASDGNRRLEAASRALLGRPYLLGPLGEGDSLLGEAKPRLRMDVFDCVTFLETSLALAQAPDTMAFLSTMDSIRYLGGRVEWSSRNHFTEAEWLPRNHKYAKRVEFPGDTVENRVVFRQRFYAQHQVEVADTTMALRMTPRSRAIERWSRPSDTTRIRGVGLVGKLVGYPVLHTGFLVERKGMPALLRHASQAGSVREQPFADYLREKPKFVGVVVWDWLP